MTVTDPRWAEQRERYLTDAILTATPAVRLTMLFDRLVMDLRMADVGFERGDLKEVNDNLVHAQEILLTLRGTLATDHWEVAPVLASLYGHLYDELLAANLTKDAARARDAAALIGQLSDAFHQAAERVAAGNPGGLDAPGLGADARHPEVVAAP